MSQHVNYLRREEFFRFNNHHRHHHRPSFFDYQRNSVFGQGYGNYGYQQYEQPHNNFFGKLLGFGAVAALGYGIGKSGGIRPFFEKIGGFFNKLFGHKEERREERREDLSGLKKADALPPKAENRQPQQGLKDMDKLQAQSNQAEDERKVQRAKETAEEKKADANTLLPTDKGYQLPEVVITAKKINKVESLSARAESNLPTGLNALKLPTQQPEVQQKVAQEPVVKKPVAEEPTKRPVEQKLSAQVDPNDKKIKPQDAINHVSEANNGSLTAEQLKQMTPEQQKKYWEEIQGAILK